IPAGTTKIRYASLLRAWPSPLGWRSGALTRHDSNQPAGPISTESGAASRAARGNASDRLFRGLIGGRFRRALLQLALDQSADYRSAFAHSEADRREGQARTTEGASR